MSNPHSRGNGAVLAEPDGDPAQDAVLDVEAAAPGDRGRVDAELVSVDEMGVDRRREQVVGGGDRMQVAGEVEVDVLPGNDLGASPAPVPPPFAPSVGPTEGSRRQTSELSPMWPSPSVSETAVVVLPSPAFVGVTAVTAISFPLGRVARRSRTPRLDLRLVAAEELDLGRIEVEARCKLGDRTQLGFGLRLDLCSCSHGSTIRSAAGRAIRADPERGADNPKRSSGRTPMPQRRSAGPSGRKEES